MHDPITIPYKGDELDGSLNKKILIFQTCKTHKVKETDKIYAEEGSPYAQLKNYEFVSKVWKASVHSIFEHLGGYDYILTGDEDNEEIIAKYFPEGLEKFKNYRYAIMRADYIRPAIIYKANQIFNKEYDYVIYMDLDFTVQKRFDDIFTDIDAGAYLVPSGNISHSLTNSFMIGRPNTKLFGDYIDNMNQFDSDQDWLSFDKHWYVLRGTGPLALNRVVRKGRYNYVSLSPKLFMYCSSCTQKCIVDEHAYLQSLPGGSWNNWSSLTYNFFMCRINETLLVILIIVLLIIILTTIYFISRRR